MAGLRTRLIPSPMGGTISPILFSTSPANSFSTAFIPLGASTTAVLAVGGISMPWGLASTPLVAWV